MEVLVVSVAAGGAIVGLVVAAIGMWLVRLATPRSAEGSSMATETARDHPILFVEDRPSRSEAA